MSVGNLAAYGICERDFTKNTATEPRPRRSLCRCAVSS